MRAHFLATTTAAVALLNLGKEAATRLDRLDEIADQANRDRSHGRVEERSIPSSGRAGPVYLTQKARL